MVEVSLLGKSIVGTNDPVIAEIFAKESEFFTKKITKAGLGEIKEFAGQGLFTTDTDEMDWQLAHKLLMPAFSPRAIKVNVYHETLTTYILTNLLLGLSTRNGHYHSTNNQGL